MNKKDLQSLAQTAAKSIKTEADLNQFRQMLTKITVEAALNGEMDHHLGFGKNEQSDSSNNRNGYTSKTLQTEDGQFDVNTPLLRPWSVSDCLTQRRRDSAVHPSFFAIDPMAAHCDGYCPCWSNTNRTAPSRSAGG
jgi:putative transposase